MTHKYENQIKMVLRCMCVIHRLELVSLHMIPACVGYRYIMSMVAINDKPKFQRDRFLFLQ